MDTEEFFSEALDAFGEWFYEQYGRAPFMQEVVDQFYDELDVFFADIDEEPTVW